MAYAEFPHTHYGDEEHYREWIDYTKKLLEGQRGIELSIKALEKRQSQYENSMTDRINHIQNVIVPIAVDNAVNKFRSEMVGLINSTNTRLNQLETKLDVAIRQHKIDITNLYDMIGDVAAQIAPAVENAVKATDRKLQALENKVNNEAYLLGNEIDDVNNNLIDKINEVSAKIDALPDTKSGYVYNFFRQENTSVDKMFKDIYNYLGHPDGFNAFQWYMQTDVTADGFNHSKVSASEFYNNGKDRIRHSRKERDVFDPVTGAYTNVKNALTNLANALKPDGLTAEDYEKLNLTAELFDQSNISAKEYDWEGKEKLKDVRENN